MPPQFTVRLIRREAIAKGTMALYFEKPPGFEFQAGQHASFFLPGASGAEAGDVKRTFTIASAPHEPDIMIATRMGRSAFKQALEGLPVRAEMRVGKPHGQMVLHEDATRPAVFLAGGIGITPMRSMLFDAVHRELPHRLFLFYSVRRPEEAPFLEELRNLEVQHPAFTLTVTVTDPLSPGVEWKGEQGYIRGEMLRAKLLDIVNSHYYLAGPPQMVEEMYVVLEEAGVHSDNIRSEEFSGY
jgi:ferredoxin-NADP reductase